MLLLSHYSKTILLSKCVQFCLNVAIVFKLETSMGKYRFKLPSTVTFHLIYQVPGEIWNNGQETDRHDEPWQAASTSTMQQQHVWQPSSPLCFSERSGTCAADASSITLRTTREKWLPVAGGRRKRGTPVGAVKRTARESVWQLTAEPGGQPAGRCCQSARGANDWPRLHRSGHRLHLACGETGELCIRRVLLSVLSIHFQLHATLSINIRDYLLSVSLGWRCILSLLCPCILASGKTVLHWDVALSISLFLWVVFKVIVFFI